jgi:crossover junction endodeoxyribonuclease RusA
MTHLSKEGRQYREVVAGIVCEQVKRKPLKRKLSMCLEAYPPDRRRRDVDNLPKAVLDALGHGGLYLDDSQIDRLLVERCDIVSGGGLRVVVFEL